MDNKLTPDIRDYLFSFTTTLTLSHIFNMFSAYAYEEVCLPNLTPYAQAALTMNGYSRLASLMAEHSEVAIVRGYKWAYALDVLYRQAELHHLLHDWAYEVKEDVNANDSNRRSYETYFHKLARPEAGEKHSLQWLKWTDVQQKLKDYSHAIKSFQETTNQRPASNNDIETLRYFLNEPGAGNNFLRGSEPDIWKEGAEPDLIALVAPEQKDRLWNLVSGPLISWLHDNFTDQFKKEVKLSNPFLVDTPVQIPFKNYSDTVIIQSINVLSTVLASLFPAISMFALIYVHDQVTRLAMILAFCFLFSVALVLVAKSTRVECFAATAAFAAVQVVFVGQQGQGCGC